MNNESTSSNGDSSQVLTRRQLRIMAGMVWLAVGLMLFSRGSSWALILLQGDGSLGKISSLKLLIYLCIGLLVGAAKGKFVLSKSAKKNITRLETMRAPLRPWQIFSPKFYPLIFLMMGFGFTLRYMASHQIFLSWASCSAIYVGIGSALMVSSLPYFKKKE